MIRQVRYRIRNFRTIRKLDLDIPRLAVLVGPNAVGKSNIVQAIDLFGRILHRASAEPLEELGWEYAARRRKKTAARISFGVSLSVPVPSKPGKIGRKRATEVKIDYDVVFRRNRSGRIGVESEELVLDVQGQPLRWCVVNGKLETAADPSAVDAALPVTIIEGPAAEAQKGRKRRDNSTTLQEIFRQRLEHLSKLPGRDPYPAPLILLHEFEGKPPKKAKRELTRILGHDYKETRDGPDLFCTMDLDKARNLSPSLNELLNALAC